MEPIETPTDAQVWIREIDALRALARALIPDEHAAEDALQETWLRARTRAPKATARPGAWLATVLRNLARDRGRTEVHRREREQERAHPADAKGWPTPDQVAVRLELVQEVAAAAAGLPEPYRSTIHMHYFEGSSAADIAKRSEQPLETVRTRVRRGLALMRARLDGSTAGGREAWSLALAPLALPPEAVAAAAGGAKTLGTIGGTLLMYKTLLATAGAALLIASTWFAFLDTGSAASPEAPAAGLGEAIEAPPDSESRLDALARSERTPVEPALEEGAASGPEELRVSGRVVVTDPDGVEHESGSGALRLAIGRADGTEDLLELEVRDGRWGVSVPAGARVRPVGLEVGERAVLLEPGVSGAFAGPDPVEVHEPLELVVRGRWTDAVILHALDDADGRELANVEVRRRSSWRAVGRAIHPGDLPKVSTVAENARSPLELVDPGSGLRLVPHWVRAPGFAWHRIDVDHDAGGERTVRLIAGGAFELRVLGAIPEGELFLRLFEPPRAEGWSFEAATEVIVDAAGRARIEDLQPGTYTARLDRGSFEATLTLARGDVTVVAGETAHLDLAADPALLDPRKTRLTGTLTIPPELDRGRCELHLTVEPRSSFPGQARIRLPLDEMTAAGDDPDVLVWSAGDVLPALYLARVTGVMHRELVDARSEEPTEAHLVVPPLASVTVSAISASTADELEKVKVTWADGDLEGVSHNEWAKVLRTGASRSLTIVAPRGTIQIAVEAAGYVTAHRTLDLEGDLNLELPLERAAGVSLSFYDGDTRLPIAQELEGLRVLDPQAGGPLLENLLDMRITSHEYRVILRPGTYELRFVRWPDGWEPTEERIVVEVPPDEVVEHRVAVRPVR